MVTEHKTITCSDIGLESVRINLASQRWRLDAVTLDANGCLLTYSRVSNISLISDERPRRRA